MRLTSQEVDHLMSAISTFLAQNNAELRLFGSRVDDHRKGGDIDLLLLLDDMHLKQQLISQKHLILAHLKELLGEQKIDLKIALQAEITTDVFLQHVYPDSICLKTWDYPKTAVQ